MAIISNAQMFGIGSSGLAAAQAQIKVASHNIANADTNGFVRSDVVYTERAIRAGVDAAAVRRFDSNMERAKNESIKLVVSDETVQRTLKDLEFSARNSNIADTWDSFVGAVYDFRQKGNPAGNKANVDHYGKQLAADINTWSSSVADVKANIQKQQNIDADRLVQLQVQLSLITDDTVRSSVQEELSTLEGKMRGQGDLITRVIPDLEGKFDAVLDKAIAKINTEFGSSPITRTSTGVVHYDSNQLTGAQIVTSSITGDTLATAMGDILQQLGIVSHQIDTQTLSDTEAKQRLLDSYQQMFGVNVVDETMKIQRATQLYDAMSKVIQIEKENFDTLIAIV